MKLLLIEDDMHIAKFLVNGFREEAITVTHATNGIDGLYEAQTTEFDVIILDIMLPLKDGFEVLAELRGQGYSVPVIILSAKHSVEERVKGLQSGADDYLVKPFAFSELLARCNTLIRRSKPLTKQVLKLSYGALTLDLLKHALERDGKSIAINQREFMLMKLLLENSETVISKTSILEHVWGHQFDPQTNVVDVLVCRLRSKVDKGFATPLIHTLRGVGYVLRS
ncbi:response regulator [Vibrio cholerae]|uniref:response regulator n=1 Tax=Vibrio cholerae TaxID=666 RepID=UPI0005B3C3E3|nr:response regulator transcription factor [Vibrio cholerae]EKF9125156.1 response regulator transcription factor [Vibrio cholerae]EKF9143457.1 response regulator transcription factor [Vibrio cholerae]RJL26030.1 DNA-binding response regulator [Vibrio cholerae]UWY94944.1 response regulator transcription factor [Vibrio cholerae]UWY98505.1 response regulator transcription factor [Vibrio cholerae]